MRGLLALLLVMTSAGPAWAHGRSLSYSHWELGERGARVELRVPAIELTRLAPDDAAAYLAEHLRLFAGEAVCPPVAPPALGPGREGWVVARWTVTCPTLQARVVQSELFAGIVASHLHFARVARAGEVRERVLVETDPRWHLAEADVAGRAEPASWPAADVARYVRLGVEHIATGWDHLAFVAALLLLAASLREVATLVTGFTIAHSLTLGLATLGVVRPDAGAVEVLIGFSIALVAAENLWLLAGRDTVVPGCCVALVLVALLLAPNGPGALPAHAWLGLGMVTVSHFGLLADAARRARVRAALAFAFGLVHGFGFAGVLTELDLPAYRLAPALFGFNAGVELGQLAVVAVAWPLLVLAGRRSGWRWHVAEAGSAAILALGIFWVVTRTWR